MGQAPHLFKKIRYTFNEGGIAAKFILMEKPKISIVTICYNSASTIEETIQSVLSQDYPLLDYVIIDGGSTDGTMQIVE